MRYKILESLTEYINDNNLFISSISLSVKEDNSINPNMVNVKFKDIVNGRLLPFILSFDSNTCDNICVHCIGVHNKEDINYEVVYIPELYKIDSYDKLPKCLLVDCDEYKSQLLFEVYSRILNVAESLYNNKYSILSSSMEG